MSILSKIIKTQTIKKVGARIKTVSERDLRKETSRLASKANKRLKRLEDGGYTNSPAYKKWLEENGEKFSVRGKSYNEVQAERAKLRNFLDSQTSTIRGLNQNLKDIAKSTGITYSSLKDLQSKADKFFELASKVEQYLRQVDDMASAIGYQKIWEAINTYTKDNNINLANAENSIEELTEQVSELIKKRGVVVSSGNDDWLLLGD